MKKKEEEQEEKNLGNQRISSLFYTKRKIFFLLRWKGRWWDEVGRAVDYARVTPITQNKIESSGKLAMAVEVWWGKVLAWLRRYGWLGWCQWSTFSGTFSGSFVGGTQFLQQLMVWFRGGILVRDEVRWLFYKWGIGSNPSSRSTIAGI